MLESEIRRMIGGETLELVQLSGKEGEQNRRAINFMLRKDPTAAFIWAFNPSNPYLPELYKIHPGLEEDQSHLAVLQRLHRKALERMGKHPDALVVENKLTSRDGEVLLFLGV